jgi:hypothetical protein
MTEQEPKDEMGRPEGALSRRGIRVIFTVFFNPLQARPRGVWIDEEWRTRIPAEECQIESRGGGNMVVVLAISKSKQKGP